MTVDQKKLLKAAFVCSIVFVLVVLGGGLVYIAVNDLIDSHSFVRLALATLGAGLVGSVAGVCWGAEVLREQEAKVIEDTEMSSADTLLTETE